MAKKMALKKGGRPLGKWSDCPTMTAHVGPEIRERVARFSWVNWSAIMRDAIVKTLDKLEAE